MWIESEVLEKRMVCANEKAVAILVETESAVRGSLSSLIDDLGLFFSLVLFSQIGRAHV